VKPVEELGYVLHLHSDEVYRDTMSGIHQVRANKGEVVLAFNNLRMNNNFGTVTTSLMDIKNAGQYICKDCRIQGMSRKVDYLG
jgi:hypothetical protein